MMFSMGISLLVDAEIRHLWADISLLPWSNGWIRKASLQTEVLQYITVCDFFFKSAILNWLCRNFVVRMGPDNGCINKGEWKCLQCSSHPLTVWTPSAPPLGEYIWTIKKTFLEKMFSIILTFYNVALCINSLMDWNDYWLKAESKNLQSRISASLFWLWESFLSFYECGEFETNKDVGVLTVVTGRVSTAPEKQQIEL